MIFLKKFAAKFNNDEQSGPYITELNSPHAPTLSITGHSLSTNEFNVIKSK